MSTTPGGTQYSGFPEPSTAGRPRKSSRGKVFAVAATVVALVAAVAVGRASVTQNAVEPTAAPAPVTVTSTATPPTVTTTVTADPPTVTAPPVTVTETATVTEAAAGPTASIKNGISLIGVDVQPGTYRSDNEDCYWARLSGTSGSFGDIIANSNGATVVTISSSDHAFESRRCSPWTQVG